MNLYKMNMLQVLIIVLLLPPLISSAREPPTVTIPDQGTLMGTYLKMFRTQTVIAYLGIPYAQPPLRHLRFTPPVVDDLPRWDGVRNASTVPPDCWQSTRRLELKKHDQTFRELLHKMKGTSQEDDDELHYDEDCLFLNIFIPDAPPPPENYAVIVWLHSGDFTHGSPFELLPFQLVFKQKVIVVTVAFRLNIFGFLTTVDGESPGNFGLMDQSAALLWINRNIKLFNGNDSAITLMGHGAGAVSASLHLTSGDWSEGMFQRTILMSPSGFMDIAIRSASSYYNLLERSATAFGCVRRPTSKLMECLRRISPQILVDTGPEQEWGPIIDLGLSNSTLSYIPDHPRNLVDKGLYRKLPVLIGYTDTEDGLTLENTDRVLTIESYDNIVGDEILGDLTMIESNETACEGNTQMVIEAVHFLYKPMPPITDPNYLKRKLVDFSTDRYYVAPILYFANQNSKNAETYVYRFDMKPRTPEAVKNIPNWMGVPHKFDLIFVWGLPYWLVLSENQLWDSADKRISDIIMTMWANFAKFGNPTEFGIYIKWDNFTQETQGVLIIDRNFNMSVSQSLNYHGAQFWNDYYPKVLGFAASCCNGTFGGAAETPSISRSSFSLAISLTFIQVIVTFT